MRKNENKLHETRSYHGKRKIESVFHEKEEIVMTANVQAKKSKGAKDEDKEHHHNDGITKAAVQQCFRLHAANQHQC